MLRVCGTTRGHANSEHESVVCFILCAAYRHRGSIHPLALCIRYAVSGADQDLSLTGIRAAEPDRRFCHQQLLQDQERKR